MKGTEDLHSIPVPTKVWAQVGVDIGVDYFSKNMEMRAIKTKSTKEVALFLYKEVICSWGLPDVIIIDQGREFCNSINKELM